MSRIAGGVRKSRKPHRCAYCDTGIPQGSSVTWWSWSDGGVAGTSYAHERCQRAYEAIEEPWWYNVDLTRIPAALLARAAADPANAHALPALQRALKAKGAPRTPPKSDVPQNTREGPSDSLCVVLPLPPKGLSPNARVHWHLRSRLAKAARARATEAAQTALHFAGTAPPQWEKASAKIIFYWRDNRRRDADNALASLKSTIDGIADAGVVADDSGLAYEPLEMRVDRERPRVEITFARTP